MYPPLICSNFHHHVDPWLDQESGRIATVQRQKVLVPSARSVFFCILSFSCIIWIANFFIFIRAGKFPYLGMAVKFLVVAGDIVAALYGMSIFAAGSHIAFFYN